ncbi:KAP family P-loop NTPase fold protein [Pseudocolwellia sp. HL-MZ7]|uniref:KAP family P-loop NTPase fold protein n=1 Tax=Pseudocolwellia sp. HL-MZ7 TaxID=3400627 RepID=UPI003CEEB568
MMNKNCKYPEWLTEYTFKNCKLNRKEYGEFLANYITGEHDGFVLNLNGAWGTGKTQFLRRMYSLLTERNHPTIYIDAWESDFSEVPLTVVASDLITQLSKINTDIGTDLDKVSEWLGKALKGSLIAGAGLLTKHLVDDSASGREIVKNLYEVSPKDFLSKIKNNHEEQIAAIKNIRKELGLLAEVLKTTHGKELPVVVLIDELDRCRPNYSIEMLEVIKHFFTTDKFVFLVATDTEQLQKSIKSVYGAEFDSAVYLKRFFDREAQLSEPDIEHYINLVDFDIDSYEEKLVLYPALEMTIDSNIKKYITWCVLAYDLSLRDTDQLIGKLKACLRTALNSFEQSKKLQIINIFSLIVAIIEFDEKHDNFSLRKNKNPLSSRNFKNNLEVKGKLKFHDFYDFNMHISVKHEIQSQSYHRNSKLVIGTHPDVRDFDSYDSVIKDAAYDFHNYTYDTDKLWFWEDYQKVVKLAGNII